MVSDNGLPIAGGPGDDRERHIISMLTAGNTGIWELDIVSGDIHIINSRSPVPGKTTAFTNIAQVIDAIDLQYRETLRNAIGKAAAQPGTLQSAVYKTGGDQAPWIETDFYCPEKGQNRILATSKHIDTQHQLAAKVRELKDKYHKLVNTLPDFIFVFNKDFIFQDIIMPDHMSLLHTREELIGSSGAMIFAPEVTALYRENIGECLRTGQMRHIEYYLEINGIKYWFQARIVPYDNDQVFALIHDIGDRVRRMEELTEARKRAEEADRMKSAFLANMSHEIRTPLNAIVGFTEVVAAEDDPATRAEYMEVIRNNNNLLLQLINDILDLSRIESGMCEIKFEETDINRLITEVETTHRFKMDEGVEFRVERPEGEIWTLTDHNRVTQILFNLISNAVKHTRQGHITLQLEIEEPYLRFSVIDTGTGIPAKNLGKIFNRFEKVDERAKGTGLGLAISQSLVERLGGTIWAESEVGKGSTFSFTIPFRTGGVVPNTCSIRRHILVAEESQEEFGFIRSVLEKAFENTDIVWAPDGEKAVNMFVLEKPSMVIMNMQLPVMSGLDAAKKIRSMSPRVPIIAITANAFYMEQQWALESGCNDILAKPFSATKLEETVLAFL